MKINPELNTPMDASTKRHDTPAQERTSFNNVMTARAQQLKQQQIRQLIDRMTQQGDKLARFRSVQDLLTFKQTVKRLLQATTDNGLSLQNTRHFRMNGEGGKLAVVRAVDDKLIELTDAIMHEEQRTIDLLDLIGEIKGLLINLYT